MQPRVQLFYNPTSGSFSPRRLKALTSAFAAEGAVVIATPSVDSLPIVPQDITHVCIAGGDGTVRHVAMNMARSSRALPLAIYPSGTINLLAREGGFQRSAASCAQALLRCEAGQPHHPVTVGGSLFLACASVGPDSLAVARVSPRLKRRMGRFAYVAAFLSVLWRWPRPRLRVTVDHREMECEAVYIAKGRYFAGPWSFAPAARVSDSVLHVLVLPRARRRDYLAFLWAMLRKLDPAGTSGIESFTCTALSIDGGDAFPVQADGDIIATCPVDLSLQMSPIHFR
jgi:diacylglycerol kinase (ATP)